MLNASLDWHLFTYDNFDVRHLEHAIDGSASFQTSHHIANSGVCHIYRYWFDL